MESWTYASPGLAKQTPDPAYYQGGHFNLDVTFGQLQNALGANGFLDFQNDVLGRSDPDPAAGGGALHGVNPRGSWYDLFHLDSANATGDVAGFLTHLGREVIRGNIGNPCLDSPYSKP